MHQFLYIALGLFNLFIQKNHRNQKNSVYHNSTIIEKNYSSLNPQSLEFSMKCVWIFFEFFVWNLSEIQTRFIQIFIQKSYYFHTMKYLERHLQTIKKSIWKVYEMYLKYIWKVSGMYRHRFRTSKFATILIIGLLYSYTDHQ